MAIASIYNSAKRGLGMVTGHGRHTPGDPRGVDSEPNPQDAQPPRPQPDDAEALAKLTMQRFHESSSAKSPHDRTGLLSLAYDKGNQWLDWQGGDRLDSIIDQEDKYRTYLTVNLVHPLVQKNVARATSSNPDVSAKPLSDDPINVEASEDARLVMDHCEAHFNKRAMLQSKVYWALVIGGAFEKIYWDAKKKADVGVQGPNGLHVIPNAPVGDLCKDVVPSFEIFSDPHAPSYPDSLWVIHAKVRALSYLESRWGKDAVADIKPDGNDGYSSTFEQRLSSINADDRRDGGTTNSKRITVYEMWERPTPNYPHGRICWVAGGRLLDYDTLENYDDRIPIVPLVYQETLGSPFPRGMVADLVPLQRHYNEVMSRIKDRLNTDFPTVLIEEGSELTPDAYTSGRNYRKLHYSRQNPGQLPPTYQVPPPPGQYWFQYAGLIWENMQTIAGVHDVSQGGLPGGDLAASAIDLLQQSDTTQMKVFLTNIEEHDKEVAEWELYFYGKNAGPVPRLWAVTDDAPTVPGPQGADTPATPTGGRVQALKALGQGECRVTVVPGSATPKLAAAQDDKILKMLGSGAFAPENLPALKIALKLLKIEASDEVYDEIDDIIQQQQANQPPPPSPQEVQALKNQQLAQAQAADHAHAVDVANIQLQSELALRAADAHNKAQQTLLEKAHPSVSLAGKLDPAGVTSAEELAGLDSDPATAKQMAIPPKPQNTNSPGAKPNTTRKGT